MLILIDLQNAQYDFSFHIRTLAFKSRHCVNWQVVASEVTWTQSGFAVCTCPPSATIGLHLCLNIKYDLSGMVHNRATTDDQWDSFTRLRRNVG